MLAVLWTVIRTKEYRPEEMRSFEQEKLAANPLAKPEYKPAGSLSGQFLRKGFVFTVLGLLLSYVFYRYRLEKELYILSGGLAAFGVIQLVTAYLTAVSRVKNGLVEIVTDIFNMPKTMTQLAVVQFLSWFALFAMWIYTTAA